MSVSVVTDYPQPDEEQDHYGDHGFDDDEFDVSTSLAKLDN